MKWLRENWQKGDRPSASWMRTVSCWLNSLDIVGLGAVDRTRYRMRLILPANAGEPPETEKPVPVKLTAKTDFNTYTGDVYGNGQDKSATLTGQTIRVALFASTADIVMPLNTVLWAAPMQWPLLGGGAGEVAAYLTILANTGRTDSMQEVGDTDEGGEAADDTSFVVGTDSKGLSLNVMTRVAYYHAGDKKLYGYIRTIKFTSTGRLATISAETRVEIEVPEECP